MGLAGQGLAARTAGHGRLLLAALVLGLVLGCSGDADLSQLVEQHRRQHRRGSAGTTSSAAVAAQQQQQQPASSTMWDPIFHVTPAKCGLGMMADPNGALAASAACCSLLAAARCSLLLAARCCCSLLLVARCWKKRRVRQQPNWCRSTVYARQFPCTHRCSVAACRLSRCLYVHWLHSRRAVRVPRRLPSLLPVRTAQRWPGSWRRWAQDLVGPRGRKSLTLALPAAGDCAGS